MNEAKQQCIKEVRLTLETKGWKLIEESLKQELSNKYYKLSKISPSGLEKLQMEINVLLGLIDSIYHLAACNWHWDGYKEIRELVQEEPSKERQLLQQYLKERSE